MPIITYRQALNDTLGEELAREWARVIVDGGKQPVPMIPSTNTLVIAGWTLAAGIGEYQGVAAPQVSVMPQTSSMGTPSARYQRTKSGDIGAAPVTRKRAR